MDLKVPYKTTKNKQEAYTAAKGQLTQEYIAKWNIPCEVKYDDSKCQIEAKGKGFTLGVHFNETEAQVSIDLSFLLKAFKKTVLEKVEHKLAKHI